MYNIHSREFAARIVFEYHIKKEIRTTIFMAEQILMKDIPLVDKDKSVFYRRLLSCRTERKVVIISLYGYAYRQLLLIISLIDTNVSTSTDPILLSMPNLRLTNPIRMQHLLRRR